MLFALLFVIAFVIGLGVYHFTRWWVYAVIVPTGLFVVSVLVDQQAREFWAFTLLLGLPITLFAGLLGAYIYQTRVVRGN